MTLDIEKVLQELEVLKSLLKSEVIEKDYRQTVLVFVLKEFEMFSNTFLNDVSIYYELRRYIK